MADTASRKGQRRSNWLCFSTMSPGRQDERGISRRLKGAVGGSLLGFVAWSLPVSGEEATVDFRQEILPLLSENCFHCHGPDGEERKADLRLDTFEGATRDLGEGAAALVPGKPSLSRLLSRIDSPESDEVMPPPDSGKSLTPGQRARLRKWISEGGRYETHWAYEPVERTEIPPVATADHPIDSFVVRRLEERGLELSDPVDRRTLLRRATFDLTGLPPSWKEVQDFVNDPAPDGEAFGAVLDRLLESPAYGERWGRHWLDLARYADTHGGSAIGFTRFPFSYTYRDYVIGAFNEDLPYDRFLLEQIAADQLDLPSRDPALAALGFLTVGRQFRNVHDRIDDQIDVITRGLLGLTVSCARCHDHKFDSIPTTDYYALHATLGSSRVPFELPLVGDPEVPESYRSERENRYRLRNDMVREQGEVMRGRLRMQVGLYLGELAKGTPEQDTSTFFLSYRTEDTRPKVLEAWRRYLAALDESDPVFGPWHRLSTIEAENFRAECAALVAQLEKENGDPKAFANEHLLKTRPPKWNPRVLDALKARQPNSFVEVAEVYGEVFAGVHRRWLGSLLEASIEAEPGGTVVPDQDAKHAVVNSAIERQLRHHLYDPGSPTALSFEKPENLTMLNRGVRDAVRGTLGAIHNLDLGGTAPPRSMILEEQSPPDESFVFLRGNPVARGEKVEPRFLTALSAEGGATFPDGRRRLGLAQAIVDPENPLTRRVIVNWIWQHHFGRGLVRTADDFGTRGEPPSHPELLDYLAEVLLEDGWSLKQLHRRIMTSATYQQGSLENRNAREIDPQNDLLWRMPPRRLEMEAMRDSLLAVSGELDLKKRGGRPFEEKDEAAVGRRSVYAFVNRDVISRMASTFDGADPSACTVKRPETVVPQQTLFALNSGFVQDRAVALFDLPEIQETESSSARIEAIYRRIFSRSASPEEVAVALEYVGEGSEDTNEARWSQFVHALLASNEFLFVD